MDAVRGLGDCVRSYADTCFTVLQGQCSVFASLACHTRVLEDSKNELN